MQTSVLEQPTAKTFNLSTELRDLLYRLGTERKIEKDTYLFHEGDKADEIYILKSGLIQINKLTSDGKEMILRICKKEDIFGELTLFGEQPTYLLSSLVIESGEVFVIKTKLLEEALMSNGSLTLEYLKWVNNHMRKFQSKIRDLLLNGKKGALYSTLIRLANSYGTETAEGIRINLSLTNQELAKFCAATRESVNRMLSELRKQGAIRMTKDNHILILDMAYLKQQINCEHCPIEVCNIN
ncbi:Crp/Fnr family transcriptional regulator [Aureibacillus halotolerans]|uniref:CRP/FNR family transcriptional regulator n=1 Tax=Aureibacillus halotolerans TaxID=1508390 RepID=A0A4R6U5C6_9BACI|nr:Crp/Fnr family transcriptional regulator [Aureibacillus halotolerans]TDQ40742.1 CRP/FNR family transcriptional regulator [Aureibacillus halotolerans]